jgi:Lar family restriction alleviation protein
MNNEKLKPCPFCGGEAEVKRGEIWLYNGNRYDPMNWNGWIVSCKNCNHIEEGVEKSEAIAAWNRRETGRITEETRGKATLTLPDGKEVHVYETPDPFSPLTLDENEIDAIRYLCSCAVVDHMLGRGVKFDVSGSRAQLIMGIHEKCETALRESKGKDK